MFRKKIDLKTEESLKLLMNNYQYLVLHVLKRYLRIEDDIEEAEARVWHEAALSLKVFERLGEREQKNLICEIARCRAVDVYRERTKHDHAALEDNLNISIGQGSAKLAEDIAGALDALDQEDRHILMQKYQFGYTTEELQQIYGCNKHALYKRIERAKGRLAKLLAEDGIDVKKGF